MPTGYVSWIETNSSKSHTRPFHYAWVEVPEPTQGDCTDWIFHCLDFRLTRNGCSQWIWPLEKHCVLPTLIRRCPYSPVRSPITVNFKLTQPGSTAPLASCSVVSDKVDLLKPIVELLEPFYRVSYPDGPSSNPVVRLVDTSPTDSSLPDSPRWFVSPLRPKPCRLGYRYVRSPGLSIETDVGSRNLRVLGSGVLVGRQAASVVRDQVMGRQLMSKGAVFFHGSAVRKGDKTVVFLGPSGAGKTTWLLHMTVSGWRPLGLDRVALLPRGGGLLAAAVPPWASDSRSVEAVGDRHLVPVSDIAPLIGDVDCCAPATIVVLRRGSATAVRASTMGAEQLVPHLRDGGVHEAHPLYLDWGGPHIESVEQRLLRFPSVQVTELTVGEGDVDVQAVDRILIT